MGNKMRQLAISRLQFPSFGAPCLGILTDLASFDQFS